MNTSREVDKQITDGVTQTNTTVMGTAPAIGTMQTYLAQAQAQGILFANMVRQQLAVASLATTMECTRNTLSIGDKDSDFFPDGGST